MPFNSNSMTHKKGPEGIPGRPGHSAKTAKGRRKMADQGQRDSAREERMEGEKTHSEEGSEQE